MEFFSDSAAFPWKNLVAEVKTPLLKASFAHSVMLNNESAKT